jgi:hypothetical protein
MRKICKRNSDLERLVRMPWSRIVEEWSIRAHGALQATTRVDRTVVVAEETDV